MKKIALVVGLSIIVVIGVAYLLFNKNDKQLQEAEVKEKFRCDRVTLDVLATDIYCQNPEYYYEDVEKGAVIRPSDFNDPRYKAMYEN